MRSLELSQFIVVLLAVFLPPALGFRLKRGRMSVLLLAVMLLQWIVEGYRWQLIPLHLATVGLALGDLVWDDRRVRGWPRFRRMIVGAILTPLLIILPVALPVPELPTPTGGFDVGTRTFLLVDTEREEIYGGPSETEADDAETDDEEADTDSEPEPAPFRRLMVQVWYPASVDPEADPEVWNPDLDVVGPAMARELGFPGFFLDHTDDTTSHAQTDAPPVSGRLPVVIYSHGWSGFRTIAINQMESLASHGFVVVAADHAYASIASVFPDGEVVEIDQRALPDEQTTDADDYQEATETLNEVFTDDLILLLDEIEAGTAGAFGPLGEVMDGDSIGLYGHSTGGGAAVHTCLVDERCDSVFGMDAWVEPVPDRAIAERLVVPSLFMRSDGWRDTPNDSLLRGIAERAEAPVYWLDLEGAGHNDFVLTPLFSPFADTFGLKGPIPADRVVPIIDDYLVGFFQRTLYGVGGVMLDEPAPSNVVIERLE